MNKTVATILTTVSFCSLALAQTQQRDTATRQKVIDEVVVVGYATKSKKELTNSISKVSDKVLESAPRSNVATALQGSVAGVRVQQISGQPGTTPNIQLRGGTGWDGGGSPLILVDGVQSSFYAINNDDVESMTVLKDAAATSIYGARAANGVILITTKKGKNGRSNINFSSRNTFNFRRDVGMEYMQAADFVRFNRMAIKNYRDQIDPNAFALYLNGIYPAATGNNTTNSIYTTMILNDSNRYLLGKPGWQTIQDPLNPNQQLLFMNNKLDDLFFQKSQAQDYTVSFDGGNDRGTFYTSLGMLDDRGIVIGSGFKRISGTLNASYKVRDNFKVSANMLYMSTNSTPSYLNNDQFIFQRARGLAPTARINYNNPDGSLSPNYSPGVDMNFGNPLYFADKIYRNNNEKRINTSLQGDWQFAPKFNLMVRGTYFNADSSAEYFAKAYMSNGALNTARQASYSTGSTMRNQITSVLSYKNTFGQKHNIDALVGTEYFKENNFSSYAATRNSPTDLIYTLNAGPEALGVPDTSKSAYAIASLFSQIHYDYDNRYLLDINFRTDGTSRLASQNRFDYFPGVAIGWNMHRESFFKNVGLGKVFNVFKPRASYGVNGNIEVLSNFGVYGVYGTTSVYGGQTGYVNSVLPNYPLLWERSTTTNFGLDLALFSNRFTVNADYFIKDVYNKHSDLVLPQWTGFSSILRNLGTLENRGLEIEWDAKIIKSEDFNWSVGGNYTRYRSFAKKLAPSSLPNNRIGGTRIWDPSTNQEIYVGGLEEGQRVGYDLITAYVFDGVYKTQAEIDADAGRTVTFARKQKDRFLGDARWKDINGDGIIDYKDRVVIGRTTPKFSGGFNTNFSYKNFNIFARADFAVGHMALNSLRLIGLSQKQGAINGPMEVTETWTPDNSTSNIPRFVFTDPQGNHVAGSDNFGSITSSSSYFWEKGDYLALREITVSYTLPGEKLNNIVKNLRIYATGANLAYFTKFTGTNPEAGGTDPGRFPIPRTFTLGLSATF